MPFPNDIQSALLFDHPVTHLEAVMRSFVNIETARTGVGYNLVEAKPGVFYRLYGGGELMVTLEYIAGPAKAEVFQPAMSSAITRIYCPDMGERLMRHKSHILIGVADGVIPSTPDIDRMLSQIGYQKPGMTLPKFLRRLEVCALLSRLAMDEVPASAVHWTQSDQLFPGEMFDALAAGSAPGMLHIHPYLYGGGESPDGKPLAGIRTFGAAHFIDREIRVEPHELPWMANFETILAFLRVATTQNGYIIPDNDTFGPEDHSLSYRVRHIAATADDVALYELEPLLYREHGYQSPHYVPRERTFDDRTAPDELMPGEPERQELLDEWQEKRAMAEGIGGRFEVRSRNPQPPAPPPPSQPTGFGVRRMFGRKTG
ncbi:hypothetical protein [Sphingopyxis sp.]|uniref:hypothetical protein n=1 Tax=Sphingopyxis sp. TaxID=1908224 RepID=UPI003D0A0EBE